MTVGEMRRLMLRKVVPEEVVPQNIVELLMDETAETAEIKQDAFTFLMRLRELGIGSADFLYLLEGCEAPRTAVDRIKANPAMNLQGLILTLESAGLTSEDYTRILYTARQIWERTLTLRLEKSEKISAENYSEEEYPEENAEDDIGGETDEPSFTEILDEVTGSAAPEEFEFTIADDDEFPLTSEPEPPETESEEESEEEPEEEPEETAFDEPSDSADSEPPENIPEEAGSEAVDEDFEERPLEEGFDFTFVNENELPKPGKNEPFRVEIPEEVYEEFAELSEEGSERNGSAEEAPKPYNGDTTAIVQIDQEMLRENLAKLAEEEAASSTDGEQSYERIEEPEEAEPVYRRGSIIAGAVGAAVLLALSAVIGKFSKAPETERLDFASDSGAVFDAIYYSYYDGIAGADNAREIAPDYERVFGDLLICGDGLGVFSEGNSVYSVTEESVSASVFENGELSEPEELLPPEETRFVAAFSDNGSLIAVFSGRESGYMKLSDGAETYTVRQDGFLTDYSRSDGEIRLATVYTPAFYRTFTSQDEEIYLPKIGKEEKSPIPAQSVVLSGTKGYSYAVSACYSLDSGESKSVCAALGDPVFAGADGKCAMNGEEGLLIGIDEKIKAAKTGRISCAAFSANGSAVCENGAINLRGNDFTLLSTLENLTENAVSLRFDGNVLLAVGENGVFLAADCSDMSAPKLLDLKRTDGAVNGENAVSAQIGEGSLTVSYLGLENGASKEIDSVTAELSDEELETVEFCGTNTAVFAEGRCGAAYRCFDGVSVISRYVLVPDGVTELFDDKTGFTCAFKNGDKLYALCGKGTVLIS